MNYPTYLLPRINNKKIAWTNDLLPLYLIRHTPDKNLYLNETKQIDPKKIEIPSVQLSDLSTNLLGESKIEDVYIKIINPALLDAWNESLPVSIPVYNTDFCIDDKRGYFFWLIGDIINCQIESVEIIAIDKIFNLSFRLRHTPKKCNFWHFSIIVLAGDIDVNNLLISDKQKKKLWRTARIQLSNITLPEISDFSTLSQRHYLIV
jgi:hypothetical protein